MTLKKCPCCEKTQTTKNATFHGRHELSCEYLFFTCKSCKSSFSIMRKRDREALMARATTKAAA